VAELSQDGVILFETVEDFLSVYNLEIRKGALLVSTRAAWNQREEYAFSISVAGAGRQVPFRAEVVYASAGKVGLQILNAPQVLERMEELVRSFEASKEPESEEAPPPPASGLPALQADGSILYPSREAFLEDCDGNLQQGSLFVATPGDLPLRDVRKFDLRILGVEKSLEIEAEVVFSKDGRTGLSLAGDPSFASRVVRFASVVRAAPVVEPEDIVEPAPAAPEPEPVPLPQLRDRGNVRFASAAAFLAAADDELGAGRLTIKSSRSFTPGAVLPFVIQAEGTSVSIAFDAEVASCLDDRLNVHAVDSAGLKGEVRRHAAALRGTAGPQESDPSAPAADGAADGFEISGTLQAARDLEAFRAMRSEPLTSLPGRVPLPTLLASIVEAEIALALGINHQGANHVFRFNDRGNLVQYQGPGSAEDLLERLLEARLITSSQRDSVQKEVGQGKFVEAVLAERKYLPFRTVWSTIRDQVVTALATFTSDGLPFTVTAIATARKSGIPMGHILVPWMELVLAGAGTKDLELELEPYWKTYPVARQGARWPIHQLVMSKKQRAFVDEYLDGKRTLSKTLGIFPPYHRDEARRIFLILHALGTLDPRPVPLGELDEDPETTLASLMEDLEKKDPFAQAGVHWSSHPNEYKPGLEKLEREFGPLGDLARISDRTRKLCARRMEMAERAQKEIRDPARRKQLRDRHVGSYQLKVSVDLLYKQVDLHIMKQDYKRARELIEVALEIHPRNEYIDKLQKLKAIPD
jgi:hypothetical protein